MPSGLTALQTKSFEQQAWFLITAIALLRTLKAVVQDLIQMSGTATLIVDVIIFLTLAGLSYSIYTGKIQRVPLTAGFALVLFIIFSYITFGGVAGASEYNMMALGVLLALGFEGKRLIIVLIFYFAAIVIADLDLHFEGWLTDTFLHKVSTGRDNYFTTLTAVLILMLYFKNLLYSESERINELRRKLSDQNKTIRSQLKELEEQQQLLHEANGMLATDIEKHTSQIILQNRIIEDYIVLSTQSIHIPMQRIKDSAYELGETNTLESMLKEQIEELGAVINNLEKDLHEHQKARG